MINKKLLSKEESVLFSIAGHFIEVIGPNTTDWGQILPSFKPFRYHSLDGREAVCSIRIVEEPMDVELGPAKVLNEVFGVLGYWTCLMETKKNYIFDVQFIENGNCYRMVSDKNFSTATAYIDQKDKLAGTVLSSFLMIVFAQSAVFHKTLLIHASVVEKEQKGYAFLGKSGTGKSTHSSLWLQYLEGVELLNDDNPAIRVEDDGKMYVYGTPWSGKTPCYKNRRVELKALIRLEQAKRNSFTWREGTEALIALLPSCSSMRWNSQLYTAMCDLLEKIIGKVKVGYLECLPDKEAALLCYEETKNINYKY